MTVLDPEKQKQAKTYARIRRRLWLVDTIFDALYAGSWIYFGWALSLREWLTNTWPLFTNPWFLVPAFVFIFGGIASLISLPLDYYSGFVLPHRFGQSNQTFKNWVLDRIKGLAIGLPLGLILIELLYLALRATGSLWWL